MGRPKTVLDRDQLVELYSDTDATIRDVADKLGVAHSVVSRNLQEYGLTKRRGQLRRVEVDTDAVVSAYQAGDSVLEVATRHDVSRAVIYRVLHEHGVELRTASDQQVITNSRRTPAERRRLVAAAHEAKRGRPNSIESRISAALIREWKAEPGNDSEARFASWLRERGMHVRHQVAVDTYNVDLAAEPVAVEVFGGNWHASGHHVARYPARCEHILDAGWSMVIVWDQTRCPMRVEAADYVVAFYEQARRDPSLVGEYRVIRGDGQVLASGRGKPDYDAFVPSQARC